mmetsp:Transcript_1392/g.3163  ORF Transcript_1392/g.3163 Transcript_1392/m.3163 type:complete len:287 (+) Transcript_1392:294-1154(+)|eukprot:CAMPEP_0204918522 /NCGR_PEP_ID=MMETSP1397-20131031/16209_1 /ASSEMBLY_ACC=CAM_ASM_000891 /TAXON_ID=49980 /ORGANISM="Climacostomum Climacostomum virens, Strain Stock W-24" /LENGTH=286 /DNA_ID=CAMNT_0052091843 /DNA_START=14 /DNA_END=874 /DNA_ORIENTATION=+
MKVLVTGASGMLGTAIIDELKHLGDVVGTYNSRPVEGMVHLAISSQESILQLLAQLQPDVVIHAAAIRSPDLCRELTPELQAINIDSARWVAEWVSENHKYMVHISSDSLFDGTAPPYTETSEPNPINIYGKTKLEAERSLGAFIDKVSILRLPVLYSRKTLHESTMTSYFPDIAAAKPIALDNWGIRVPTAVQDVAKAILKLVETRSPGLYQFSGNQTTTKYAVGVAVSEKLGVDPSLLTPVEGASGAVARAKDCTLVKSSFFADISTTSLIEDLPLLLSLVPGA